MGAQLGAGADPNILIHDVKPLVEAGAGELSFFDNRKYLPQLQATRASACLVAPGLPAASPGARRAGAVGSPYRAFALALQRFYPDA